MCCTSLSPARTCARCATCSTEWGRRGHEQRRRYRLLHPRHPPNAADAPATASALAYADAFAPARATAYADALADAFAPAYAFASANACAVASASAAASAVAYANANANPRRKPVIDYHLHVEIDSYIADPYWPEVEQVINIQKQSGMNRARSSANARKALEEYLRSAGLTLADYDRLVERSQRPFYTDGAG
ncbi:MAG TPA: hypothetical protein VNI83_09340, partial [Vicinamibacterales bacterium]|nr:hypothetical protein [Vicinamibacterales bacterium]